MHADKATPSADSPGRIGLLKAPFASSPAGLDIALCGVPFDLGSYYRIGARQTPAAFREYSWLARPANELRGESPFHRHRIADIGDAPINYVNFDQSMAQIEAFFRQVRQSGACPLSVGGDHTSTYPILRGYVDKTDSPLAMIHFDAHPDTYDEIGGSRVNVGTPFRRAIEDGLIDPRRHVMIGIRAVSSSDPLAFARDKGITVLTMEDFDAMGRAGTIQRIKEVVGNARAYISFDIDALDTCHAPGTAAPEPGGLSVRDSLMILRGLRGLNVVGGDLVEISPPFDAGNVTVINGLSILYEMLTVLVAARPPRG
jgi:guanidinopropionase